MANGVWLSYPYLFGCYHSSNDSAYFGPAPTGSQIHVPILDAYIYQTASGLARMLHGLDTDSTTSLLDYVIGETIDDSKAINFNFSKAPSGSEVTHLSGDVETASTHYCTSGGTNCPTPVRGEVALVSGTATVSNSAACAVGSTCIYKLTNCGTNSSVGIGLPTIGTITAGTSFVINSVSAADAVVTTDVSTICWQIN
jgi:hypothetical protein